MNTTSPAETSKDSAEKTTELRIAAQPHLVGVATFSSDMTFVSCNRLFLEFFDFPEGSELIGKGVEDIFRSCMEKGHFSIEDLELLTRLHHELFYQPDAGTFEYAGPFGFQLEVNATQLENGSIVVTYTDVTMCNKRISRLEKESASQQDMWQVILDNMREGITLYDADHRLCVANRLYLQLLRYPDRLGIPGTPFEDVARYNAERGDYGPGDVEELVKERVSIAKTTKVEHHYERTLFDGTVLDILGKPLPDGGFIGFYADLTERKKMARLAFYDSLTNLPNRRLFIETLTREMQKAKRIGLLGALLYLNLDGFKAINDSLGHETGDQVLLESAQRIVSCLREHDLAARLSGDSFAIVLDRISDREVATDIALRIIQAISAPVVWKNNRAIVGASVGVVFFDTDFTPDTLLQAAERAMFAAKGAGKGVVKVFCGGNEDILDPNFI